MINSEITQREAEIQARIDAATPGEWVYDKLGTLILATDPYGHGRMRVVDIRGWGHLTGACACNLDYDTATNIQTANGDFIVNAKLDLIWQAERIKELKAELEKCQSILVSACDGYCPNCWRSGTESCLQEG